MQFSLLYIAQDFFYRLFQFFRHWYVKSVRIYSNFVINQFERMDQTLAWRITYKNLFKPLYGDYSFIGRVLGFFFRIVRLFVGAIVYICVLSLAFFFYLLWILFPLYVAARVIHG